MPQALFATLLLVTLSACVGASSAKTTPMGRHIVAGVEDGDMLKMRAGPGTGYVVVLGLPNGTAVDVQSCQPTGNTRWCRVTIGGPRGVEGHVSGAYLQEL